MYSRLVAFTVGLAVAPACGVKRRSRAELQHVPMKPDRIRRVGKGVLLHAVPTRGHVACASAGSFAHPTILFEWNALYPSKTICSLHCERRSGYA